MGGSDAIDNLVELTIEEHAEAHRLLWEQHGKWQDYIAWQGLLRNIGNDEIISLKQSLGGREGGLKTKGVPKTPEHRKRLSEIHAGQPSPMEGKKHSDETRKKIGEAQKGRPKSWKGIHRTPEQKERYRLAALKRWSNRSATNITS
jgi:hypothetical protein